MTRRAAERALDEEFGMSQHLKMEGAECTLIEGGIYVSSGFYSKAETLRGEFDKAILGQNGQHGGITPLAYAYSENAYQFLTAGAERCFSEAVVADVIGALERWGNAVLGTSHVSTPQVRVYVRGCSRKLYRDNVAAAWHFVLSLTANHIRVKRCKISILRESIPGKGSLSIDKIVNSAPVFNQLLVHSTREPYSVEGAHTSMNPLEGTVLLDGYMW
jgi:hypothetical protein